MDSNSDLLKKDLDHIKDNLLAIKEELKGLSDYGVFQERLKVAREDIDKAFIKLRSIENEHLVVDKKLDKYINWGLGFAACITLMGGYLVNKFDKWVASIDNGLVQVQRVTEDLQKTQREKGEVFKRKGITE